jgi:hypothetical protein
MKINIRIYLTKSKYNGKPNPKDYNYFVLSQRGIGYLLTDLRQH